MKKIVAITTFLAASLLGGCGGDEHQDLRQWMREQEKGMRGRIDPLPQVKPYMPLAYSGSGLIEPFSPLKAKIEGDRKGANLPDFNRQREPLEEFPLETLKLVGIFQDKQRLIAHLLANGRSYQVKVGSYVGQSFGRVVRIVTAKNEEKVVVKELVKDPDDQWVERESELLLDSRGVQQ
jgi:type IV pilus assembly protein PilP